MLFKTGTCPTARSDLFGGVVGRGGTVGCWLLVGMWNRRSEEPGTDSILWHGATGNSGKVDFVGEDPLSGQQPTGC